VIFVATTDGDLVARSARAGTEVWSAKCGDVRALDASPSGLVAAGLSDGTIEIVDAASGRHRGSIRAHAATVLALAFMSDGRHLVSAGGDGAVRMWNALEGTLVATPAARAGGAAALHRVAGRIVIAWPDGSIETVAAAASGG
jgi:WD40 repeat protein